MNPQSDVSSKFLNYAAVGILVLLVVWVVFRFMGSDPNDNYVFVPQAKPVPTSSAPANFQECLAVGGARLESFPEQCVHEGKTFVDTTQPNIITYTNEKYGYTFNYDAHKFAPEGGVLDSFADEVNVRDIPNPDNAEPIGYFTVRAVANPSRQNTESYLRDHYKEWLGEGEGVTYGSFLINEIVDFKGKSARRIATEREVTYLIPIDGSILIVSSLGADIISTFSFTK